MGRGTNNNDNATVLVGTRGAARTETRIRRSSVSDMLKTNEQDLRATVVLPDGEMIDSPEGLGTLAQGLASVTSVSESEKGYRIIFDDGSRALVSLDDSTIAISGGPSDDEHVQGALAASLAYNALLDEATSDEERIHLGDLFDAYLPESSDYPNHEHLQELTEAVAKQMQNQENNSFVINDPETLSQIKNPNALPMTNREYNRMLAHEAEQKMAQAYAQFGEETAGRALIIPIDPETGTWAGGHYFGVTDEDLERRQQVAINNFGGLEAIPKSGMHVNPDGSTDGLFDLSGQDIEAFQRLGGRILAGQRSFMLIGPAGSGKDTFVKEACAHLGYPVATFNIGPTYELEDALGGHGLKGIKVIHEETGEEEIVTGSITNFGPLARALEQECAVVIQEPEGQEEDFVRLHGLMGDNIGPKGEDLNVREGTISSPTGNASFKAHPGALLFITANPQEDESTFRESTKDRMGHFDFEYRDAEVESRRWARMVTSVMKNQSFIPQESSLVKEWTAEEVRPMVDVIQKFREMHEKEPHNVLDVPGARKGVETFCSMVINAYGGDEYANSSVSGLFSPYFPPLDTMSEDERNDILNNDIFSGDISNRLDNLVQQIREKAMEESGEEE